MNSIQNPTIDRLAKIITHALGSLEVEIALDKAAELATTVFAAMSAHSRNYHNLEHVFGFITPNDPIGTLAALYHDVVYYQVDLGFAPEIRRIINPYMEERDNSFFVSDNISSSEKSIWLALEVFDLIPGQKLSSIDALNEFLSAIVLVQEVGSLISMADLLRILACIEATIPFRLPDSYGQTPTEVMQTRLLQISKKYCNPELTQLEIENLLRAAVNFANQDISNFAEENPANFLANTWKLLPERNSSLRSPESYTIRNYCHALQAMEAFMSNVNPLSIFRQYKDTPPDQEYWRLTNAARENIDIAQKYMRIHLVAAAVLDALSQVSGGDFPLPRLTGRVLSDDTSSACIKDYLPAVQPPPWAHPDSALHILLRGSCADNSDFDTCNAHVALFVYLSLSPDQMEVTLSHAREMLMGALTAMQFLGKVDRNLLAGVAQAMAVMLDDRREALQEYF